MIVPAAVADTLKPEMLTALEAVLAPAFEKRASVVVEVEIEAVGEGTFTIRFADRLLTAKKGFAKKPLASAKLGKGVWKLLRDELQVAVDGFPQAPELRARHEEFKATSTTADADAVIKAIERMAEGLSISFDIKGEGVITLARGPVDEATRELKIALDGAQVRALLTGAALNSVRAGVSGDRSVGTAVLAALGPALKKLKPL
ncbi:MAG: hypothetical protein Q8O67_28150 [Deltaproteobacteria bacterium]|nr:hypothetical protein [Deltaproteobacteria bacterium]